MNEYATTLLLGVPPAFLLGLYVGGLIERHRPVTRDPFTTRLYRWFARDDRLVALVVIAMVLAIVTAVYAFNSDKSGSDRDDRFLTCITNYVDEAQKISTPITLASREMQAARRDWDRGYSTDDPSLSKEQLKRRYLNLYDKYEKIQVPPLGSVRKFCEGVR